MDSAIPNASIRKRPFLVLAILAVAVLVSASLLLSSDEGSSADISDDWSYESGAGVLIYKGPEDMPDYTETENPITVLSADNVLSIDFSTKNVRNIGSYALYNCKTLITAEIPSTVLTIGNHTFMGCISLTSIDIPIGVEEMGDSAFEGCISIEEVNMPAGLATINPRTFFGCTSLSTVNMSTNIHIISDSAFQDCSVLGSFAITDSVTTIGKEVFSGCSSLTSVSVGAGLRSLGERAFFGCTSLSTIGLTDKISSYGPGLFYGCTSLAMIYIGTGCTSIPDSMFRDCSSLKEIQFNTSIRTVGDYSFSGCTSLYKVMFKDSDNKSNLRSIGESAFENCTTLTSIVLPAALKAISDNAFKGCNYLYEVCNESELSISAGSESNGYVAYYALRVVKSQNDSTVEIIYNLYSVALYSCMLRGNDLYIMRYVGGLPEVETPTWIDYKGTRYNSYYIYDRAFEGFEVITSVSITGAVESVGADAFKDCVNLETLNIFIGPRYIGDNAFSGCIKVKSVEIPGSVESIGTGVFIGCTSMTSIVISNTLTVITESAFEGCTALKSVSMPNSLIRIESKAFMECGSLDTTSFPSTLEFIGDYSFKGCRSLKTVEFESALVHIGDYAFDRCISIKTVILPRYLSELGEAAFVNCSSLKELSMGSEILILRNDTFRGCSSLERISLSDNIAMIEDNAFYNCSSLKSVRLPSALISIGQSAFYNCSSLTYLSMPSNLATVGAQAFYNCSAMATVTVEINLVSIGDLAFYNCTQLKKVVNRGFISLKIGSTDYGYIAYYAEVIEGEINEYTIDNMRVKCNNSSMDCVLLEYTGTASDLYIKTVEVEGSTYKVVSIGESAFQNCLSLTRVTFPVVLSSIESYAFKGCTNLVSASFESTSIMFIGSHAFEGCHSLTDIIIPQSVLSVNDYAFNDCTSVRNVTIMDGPASIGMYAFSGCSMLINLSIGDTVESIGDHAFENCTRLSEIVLPTGLRSVGSKVFIGCNSLRTITVDGSNTYFKTVDGVLYNFSQDTLLVYPAGKQNESFAVPNTVLDIAESSFYGNIYLYSINLHEDIRTIGALAFSGCSSIVLIDLKNVSNIGSDALYGCTALTKISVSNENESYSTDGGALYTKDMAVLIVYPSAKTDNVYTIASETVVISDHAFNRCMKLNTLTIPASVGTIGVNSIDCPKLTSLIFGAVNCSDFDIKSNVFANAGTEGDGLSVEFTYNVVHIPSHMFYVSEGAVSPKITSITIGANVTSIGKLAFGGDAYLSSINFQAIECSDLDRDSEIFSGAGLSGNGITVTFGEAVRRVPNNLFYSVSVPKVTSAYIGDRVETIGTNAFVNCSYLRTVYIGLGVQKIGDFAFYGTTSLETVQFYAADCYNLTSDSNTFVNSGVNGKGISVTIGDSVMNVPSYMFYTNSKMTTPNLTSLKLGMGIIHIGDYAFYNCANLDQLTIPGAVTSIGSNAFTNCSGLKELTIGGSVSVIGSYAFSDCLCIEKFTYYAKECNDLSKNSSSFMNMGISGDGINVNIANTVTKIPSYLFYESSGASANVTKLTIGSGVTSIGTNAFYGLDMIDAITFNAKKCMDLTSLSNVFYDAGTKGSGFALRVGDGVLRIPAYLMYVGDEDHAPNMISLFVGTGVTAIGNCAFYNSIYLTSVEFDAINCSDLRSTSDVFYAAGKAVQGIYLSIGDSVQRVPACLFYVKKTDAEGSKLLSVSIGRSVTSIGDCAFYNSPNLMSINYYAFSCADLNYSSNVFFNAGNGAKELYLTFGDSVRLLPSYLFFVDEPQYSPNIHDITIHDNTTHIGTGTFASCSAVTNLTIGFGITEIGPNAFKNCSSVKTMTYSAINCSDLQYSSNVFYNVGADEGMTVKISDGVEKVPDYLFYIADSKYCPRVTNLTVGDIVGSIGNNAFSSCTMLRTVYLGSDITSIGIHAFYMCPSLSEIRFNCESCGDMIQSSNVFFDCGVSSGGMNISFGDKVKSIPSYLFYSNVSGHDMNIRSLIIGPNVKEIGAYSFSRCSIKGDITISDNIENIKRGAFSDCSMLDSITIGANVKLIEPLAFSGCTAVTSLRYNAYDCSNFTYDSDVFMNLGSSKGGVDLVIGNGVKKIPAYLCCGSEERYSPNIISITIPSTVLSIGSYAFSDCTYIKSITYNAEICVDVLKTSNIFKNAGRSADGIAVQIGDGVRNIPANLFNIDDSLCYPKIKTLTIGTNVTVIGQGAFNNCAEIETINYNVKNCSNLVYEDAPFSNVGMNGNGVSIVLGGTVSRIPDYLFCNTPDMGISKFSSLMISSGVEEIGKYAFAGCSGLPKIDLPKTICVIGDGAFYGCSSIQTICLGKDVSSLGFAAFGRCNSLNEITVDGENEAYKSIDGVLFTKDKKTLIQFPSSSSIKSYMVPDRVKEISDNAFAGSELDRLYVSVTIEKIGNNAFPTKLKTLEIAGNLTYTGKSNLPSDIEKMVFYNGSSGFGNLLGDYIFTDESGMVITDYSLLSGGIYETNSITMAYTGDAGEPPSRPVDPWIELSGDPWILIVAVIVVLLAVGFIVVLKKRLYL